jgi:hypothetical protein
MAGTSKRPLEMGRWPAPMAAILSQRDVRDKVSCVSRLRREAGRQRRDFNQGLDARLVFGLPMIPAMEKSVKSAIGPMGCRV